MLLSHQKAVPSPQRSLTSVFGMGTGVTSLPKSPAKIIIRLSFYSLLFTLYDLTQKVNKKGGQASRPISTGQLKSLPTLHIQPINPVVFRGPSVPLSGMGYLIFGEAWCLDAFSTYPFAT